VDVVEDVAVDAAAAETTMDGRERGGSCSSSQTRCSPT
jgi:hypothetical protein